MRSSVVAVLAAAAFAAGFATTPARSQAAGDGGVAGFGDLRLRPAVDALGAPAAAAAETPTEPVEPVEPEAPVEPIDAIGLPEEPAAAPVEPLAPVLPVAAPPAPGTIGAASAAAAPAVASAVPLLRPTLGAAVRPAAAVLPLPPRPGLAPAALNTEEAARADYDPIGLRFGATTVTASVTSALGYTSNAGGVPDGEGAATWRLRGEARAVTDLERGGLDLALRGGVRDFLSGDAVLEPDFSATADGRFDVTEVDRLTAGFAYRFSKETGFSPETGSGTGTDIHVLSATAGYARTAGLVGVTVGTSADRTVYAGDDRDNTALAGTLRLSLDSGAVLQPFVETSLTGRILDRSVDENGYRRNSVGGEGKIGTAVDTGLVTGEVALGWGVEAPEDDRLDPLRGALVEASLAWTPTALTTVTVTADTTFETSRLAGASGSIARSVGAGIAHALRPNLILDGGATLTEQDYQGIDRRVTTVALRAGATWRLNPFVELNLTATHERADSSVAGEDTTETTIEAGVTVRR